MQIYICEYLHIYSEGGRLGRRRRVASRQAGRRAGLLRQQGQTEGGTEAVCQQGNGGTERDRQRWQACARKGWSADPAEQPTQRSEAKGGGSGVGAAAKALQRGGLPALAVSLCAAPAGTLPPGRPAPAGLAEGRSCPARLPACLRGRGLGTRRRRPSLPPSALRSRVSGGLFLPFILHGAHRVRSGPFRTFSACLLHCKFHRLYFISRK